MNNPLSRCEYSEEVLISEITYDRVSEALFDRKVPAGAFVSQNDLANLLDIPVQPLRDALRVLEAARTHDGSATETAVSRHFQAALQPILGMF